MEQFMLEEYKDLSIYKKIIIARSKINKIKLNKSGKLPYHGSYKYFQLEDIQPIVTNVCEELGIFTHLKMKEYSATMDLINADDPEQLVSFSIDFHDMEVVRKAEKNCQSYLQSIGSQSTYITRYLLIQAFNLCEDDTLEIISNDKRNMEMEKNKSLTQNDLYKQDIQNRLNDLGIQNSLQKKYLLDNYEREYREQSFKAILDSLEEELNNRHMEQMSQNDEIEL